MPIQPSDAGLGRTLLSTFQTGDITFISSGRLYPETLMDDVKNLVLGGYAGIQNVVDYITHVAPGQQMGDPQQSVILHNQTASAQHVTTSHQETGGMLEQGLHSHSNSESFLSEVDNMEEGGQPATHEDHSSGAAAAARSKRTWMLITVLIVGALSLVVVPGLVVGVITGQMPWGIALAGATATLVSFFAGLYYHHNK